MAASFSSTSSIYLFSFFSFFSFFLFFSTQATSHVHLLRRKLSTSDQSAAAAATEPPATYFEVTRPLPVPAKDEPCSTLVLQHDFGYTYGLPPVNATYSPPDQCRNRLQRRAGGPTLAVLEWSAASRGLQFDRIFGVWLGGAELLRSCTAEPSATGIVWTVRKDVTRYAALFARPQTLAVYLGNLVDINYTGVFHVNVSLHFYFESGHQAADAPAAPSFTSPADLIIPISRSLPLNDGLWFVIQNSTDVQTKKLAVPSNTYRAVLEVYVSYHSDDEFWYTNPPEIYIENNNLTGLPGNGPFREVTARLDGEVVGAVWPFTVIYTGGINPLLWRPITGIGSFDLPSYDIEITPFLGKILDGREHEFGFGVTDALHDWYVDANLHLWLDSESTQTAGMLIKHDTPELETYSDSQFKNLDGRFKSTARRKISSTGWVKSSLGNITTHFFQELEFDNFMELAGNGSIQVVNQTIYASYGTFARQPASILYSEQVFTRFPLYLYSGISDQVNDSYTLISNLSLGFEEKKISGERLGFSYDALKNSQTGQATMRVKGSSVASAIASTQQVYEFESTHGCYYSDVRSSNYTILHDEEEDSCTDTERSPLMRRVFSNCLGCLE